MSHPPSVDKLARSIAHHDLPWPVLVEIARNAIATDSVDQVENAARRRSRALLRPVINGTGVLLHTNMGRAPISADVTANYTNLEIDLQTGERGSRQHNIGELLALACGAEAALVVNNCASAVLLALAALGQTGGVAVSRSELVEIGGGFRIPDVMKQSGATLVEVGTTNRTRLADYQRAVSDNQVGLALKVHQSNYKIVGFTEDVTVAQLASLDIPVLVDIGSGLLDSTCPWLAGRPPTWLENEPAARQTLEAGAALVMFSGDKLFGGPQAGVLAGDADLIRQCARHPLARALRPGGLVLSALQETTLAYLRRDGQSIEFWRTATYDPSELEARAQTIVSHVRSTLPPATKEHIQVEPTEAVPGGGTLPTVTIPSFGVHVRSDIRDALRFGNPPILARMSEATTTLDMRTISPSDDGQIAESLSTILADLDQ